jgi:drug/metabolite transporter (DMT)-like permease
MAMVATLGFLFLHEPMSWTKGAGMLLIAAGAFALTR